MNLYDINAHIAECYDQRETDRQDVELIRKLIGDRQGLHILEPFCGTGRILIPLVQDGHFLFGLDQSDVMLDYARRKLERLDRAVRERVQLQRVDVTSGAWPQGFDLVVLGGNCFYELATPEEQAGCLHSAWHALRPGGWVYVDNDHMEGELDLSWQQLDIRPGFPSGICADGTVVESTMKTVWCDVPQRLVRFRRNTRITLPGGETIERQYEQQKHPVSASEVQTWLEKHAFVIEGYFGDRMGSPYTPTSPRAIFWARKKDL